jgi:uncharacterized protein YycO
MSTLIHYYGLKPADKVVVPKSNWRVVQHHAIYLGQDDYGRHWMVENTIGIGVRLIEASAFFNGVLEITRIERFTGTPYERKVAVQRALAKVGQPYNLINYNCEHFASEVQTGRSVSRQVANGVGIAAGVALLFMLFGGGK